MPKSERYKVFEMPFLFFHYWRSRPSIAFLFPFHILVFFFITVGASFALKTPIRLPSSPGYQERSACPARCEASGPNPGNWSLYRNFDQFQPSCQESVFYYFNIHDAVDDPITNHRIYACTSYGPDWGTLPASIDTFHSPKMAKVSNVTYQIGWWPEAQGTPVASSVRSLTAQLRQYLGNGFARTNEPVILFTSYGSTSVGLYIGEGLQNEGIADLPLQYLENAVISLNDNNANSMAMQFCQQGQNAQHVFGLIATGNGIFGTVQDAVVSWSKAQCLTFPESHNVGGSISLVTPLYTPSHILGNSTSTRNPAPTSSAILADFWLDTSTQTTSGTSTYVSANDFSSPNNTAISTGEASLAPRTTCSTVQVVSGDSCASLSQKCGITPAEFTEYNPEPKECSTLQPGEHVCCSVGTLPNFAPKPNPDGSCATYTVQANDNCAEIAAEYDLNVADINKYNADTWAWNGCADIWVGTIICLSTGTPPMPAPVSNAVCGPQVPGTKVPTKGENITDLNPCPLNACCDVFGQCGTTSEFCRITSTGAPGTAAPGTDGCISNCGTTMVRSSPPATYRSVGFFEGFNLERVCLFQTFSQIDFPQYTHIYFAFGVLSSSYEIQIPNATAYFEFEQFVESDGPLRILSIGGWAFSTDPSTYMIFREGVTLTNREAMATNIANFINAHVLDGVNIDWEYPGAPDIPGIPPASPDDGENYLAFLAILRELLPDKEITVAAPASYWYLKGFPIAAMSKIVDYVIYMTYDLHGQWDSGNQWSQLGCPSGTCLRTDVNLTETIGALIMITKAGVPSNQVVVGVTSYGRSFRMAEERCYGPMCTFLGSADDSEATPGPCTQTPGYIANAEILAILANSSRVNDDFVDATSNTNILVYDSVQWVGWMSDDVKASRTSLYQSLNMGGTTDWASDLQKYNLPPINAQSWATFVNDIAIGTNPFAEGKRTGNWTELTCSDPAVENVFGLTSQERWDQMDCPNAWSDILNVWYNYDRPAHTHTFTASVMNTIHANENANCGEIATVDTPNCDQTQTCAWFQGFGSAGSGPAAYEIYNSLVLINEIYSELYNAITTVAATYIDLQVADLVDTFAPVPPSPSNLPLLILTAFASLGLTAIAAPFFDGVFGALPALAGLGDAGKGVVKDVTYAAIAFGGEVATATLPGGGPAPWTASSQANFTAYLGQVLYGWETITANSLWALFDGTPSATDTLTTYLGNGNLIEGKYGTPAVNFTKPAADTIESSVNSAFFTFAIPAVWSASGTNTFVMESGYPCTAQNPMQKYMSNATQEATYACYEEMLYYLVYPKGTYRSCAADVTKIDCFGCTPPPCTPSQFEAPPGLSSLGTSYYGEVTLSRLIEGAVKSYRANGNTNGGPIASPTDPQTLTDLIQGEFTTPGYVNLPVCSPQVALASWSTPSQSSPSAPNYPCNPLQGITKCSSYSYTDETTSASPIVSDCETLISNIAGSSGKWTTGIGDTRKLATFGTCNFDVKNTAVTGDVTFETGSQDIVTIIQTSIKNYAFKGLVGARGYMSCSGDAGSQNVTWGLY